MTYLYQPFAGEADHPIQYFAKNDPIVLGSADVAQEVGVGMGVRAAAGGWNVVITSWRLTSLYTTLGSPSACRGSHSVRYNFCW